MFQRNINVIVVGSALALVTTALYPVFKETLRPIAHDLTKQMKYLVVITKEGIEDIAAEVKFERIKKSIDKDNFIDSKFVETEQPNRIF